MPVEPPGEDDRAASAVAQLPDRPAELSLVDVQPCELFGKRTLDALHIDRPPKRSAEAGVLACTLSQRRTQPAYDLLVTSHPDAGVETWINGRAARPGAMEAEPVTIGAYPAVRMAPPSKPAGQCETAVGVASGQTLHVRLSTAYRDEIDHDDACALAAAAAAAALTELRQKG